MRRLPGPADHRPGDGGDSRGSLRIVSGLAENTNSIFCDGSAEPEAANGCPVLLRAGTNRREATRATANLIELATRSPEREKKTRVFQVVVPFGFHS